MKILRQVEIAVMLMPIYFAQSMPSCGQYEMKSSEARPFRGSILIRFEIVRTAIISSTCFFIGF